MSKKAPVKSKNIKEVWIKVTDAIKIRMEVNEYQDKHRVDIREYVESSRYTGFTKKGVNIPTELLEEMYKGLGELLKTVKKEGLFNVAEEKEGA